MARVPVQSPDDSEKPAQEDNREEQSDTPRVNPGLIERLISKRPTQAGLMKMISIVSVVVLMLVVLALVRDRSRLEQKVEELSSSNSGTSNQSDGQAEAEELKTKVEQFIELAADETPTIATVVDASKVSSQPFFARAKNGDKVLLFAKTGKAILYRPDTNKIIEIAPINLGNTQPETPVTPQQ